MLGKIVLPWFGGGAEVWIACLVFFQVLYLLGNAYAHLLIRHQHTHWPARIHITLLSLSLFFLPIVPSPGWKPHTYADPALWIFLLLVTTIGLPFLLLSATSPLLQAWYVRSNCESRPYRFYSLSNAGSFLALLSYPVLIEPHLTTRHQAFGWSFGYAIFVVTCAWIAFRMASSSAVASDSVVHRRPHWKMLLLWAALAADASALLLAITNHISQNVAAVPLLWIVPLSLYLLSLMLCFDSERWYRRSFYLRLLAVALAGMTYALAPEFANAGPSLQIPLFCMGLFVCCMVCHGELARRKPQPQQLTTFYLMIAAGGAFGGIFVGLIAPRIFREFYELPIALAGCAILTFLCAIPENFSFFSSRWRRAIVFGGAVTVAVGFAFLPYFATSPKRASSTARTFYGIVRVEEVPAAANQPARRDLLNGTIVHGIEILEPGREMEATTYYGPDSGAARALNEAHKRGSIHAGIIGLGAGTLATYGQPGDQFTFYEINPLVIKAANSKFAFLPNSRARIDIVPGDARISLEREPSQNFDVLLADAFSGDAIPVHLLTLECFRLYLRHLKPNGFLAIHISNKFLNLKPVVQAAAESLALDAETITNDADPKEDVYTATWVLLHRRDGIFPDTMRQAPLHWSREDFFVRPWTDDYSSLFKLFR